MNNLLYIVFNESGYYLSELLKEYNSNLKILHFCDKNKFKDTKADLRVELELNDNIWVGNEYLYYKYLSKDKPNNIFFTTSDLRDYHYKKQKDNAYYHINTINLPFQNIEFYLLGGVEND